MKNAARLLALLRANAAVVTPQDFCARHVVAKTDTDAADVYLYGPIDSMFGISADGFAAAFDSLAGRPINLRIDSVGGDVFEAVAMATRIARHDAPVTAYIDGLAASSATRVAQAASRVVISDSAMYMIHNSWTLAYGNKDDLGKLVNLLGQIDERIVNDYTRRTGKSAAQVQKWMDDETWFTAQDAIKHGFADEIQSTTQRTAEAEDKWDLGVFASAFAKTAPRLALPKPAADENITDATAHAARVNRARLAATLGM